MAWLFSLTHGGPCLSADCLTDFRILRSSLGWGDGGASFVSTKGIESPSPGSVAYSFETHPRTHAQKHKHVL